MTESGNEPVLKRAYYSIGEVCDLVGLKPHVLRYWETQFEELAPDKNRAGNRVYRPREVKLVFLVQRLVHQEKYTIEGARKRLKEIRSGQDSPESQSDVTLGQVVAGLKDELAHLKQILTIPE
ncbi:MAG: MerR family transcriptional regulator [Gemmatimonadales bacterium]|nr:MAG: MerR family transcriptional regulator [Gemmatimonadales bacterium]